MLIRCEKCSTVYELDDKLLPAHGAPVQCSKCQFVFKAYPVAAAEPLPNGGAGNGSMPPEPARPRNDDWVREGGALANSANDFAVPRAGPQPSAPPPPGVTPGSGPAQPPPFTGVDEPRFTVDGRPIRKVPFPGGDTPPTAPRAPVPPRAPTPTRTAGAASAMRLAIVVVVLLALLVAGVLAWRSYHRRGGRSSGAARDGQSRLVTQGGTPDAPARK